jgi:hypothetical protein
MTATSGAAAISVASMSLIRREGALDQVSATRNSSAVTGIRLRSPRPLLWPRLDLDFFGRAIFRSIAIDCSAYAFRL